MEQVFLSLHVVTVYACFKCKWSLQYISHIIIFTCRVFEVIIIIYKTDLKVLKLIVTLKYIGYDHVISKEFYYQTK